MAEGKLRKGDFRYLPHYRGMCFRAKWRAHKIKISEGVVSARTQRRFFAKNKPNTKGRFYVF